MDLRPDSHKDAQIVVSKIEETECAVNETMLTVRLDGALNAAFRQKLGEKGYTASKFIREVIKVFVSQ